MARTDFSAADCSVARGLTEVGDIWSFLVVREAMFGVRRFSQFQRNLQIARTVLRDRLNRLVENGVLNKVDAGQHGPRFEYELTEKGRDLFTVMIAVRQWADRWVEPQQRNILVLTDKIARQPLPDIGVRDSKGKPVGLDDVSAQIPEDYR